MAELLRVTPRLMRVNPVPVFFRSSLWRNASDAGRSGGRSEVASVSRSIAGTASAVAPCGPNEVRSPRGTVVANGLNAYEHSGLQKRR